MDNSKYYNSGQGEVEYNGGLGKIYYKPTGGNGDGSSNFMTTANFSRTERTKTMSVVPSNTSYGTFDTFGITQNDSPLMILLDDINGGVTHGTIKPVEPLSSNSSYYFTYEYPIHQGDLGEQVEVVVLINGNVISIDGNVTPTSVITSLPKKYDYKLPGNGYVMYLPIGGGESYEDYPTGVGTNVISTYRLDYSGGFKYNSNFDTITHSGGYTNSIDISNGAGGLTTDDYLRYGEIQGLIIIRFYVDINNSVPSSNETTINIGTAVYDEHGDGNVSDTWPEYRELKLTFKYDGENPSINAAEDLNFSADGTGEGTTNHEPAVNIESNIAWQIRE